MIPTWMDTLDPGFANSVSLILQLFSINAMNIKYFLAITEVK